MARRRSFGRGALGVALPLLLSFLLVAVALPPERASGRPSGLGPALVRTSGSGIPCPPRCAAIFEESGLPGDPIVWSITLNGSTQQSASTTIGFTDLNGTYQFSVGRVAGYTASPSSGSVTVDGRNVTQQINFTATEPLTLSNLESVGILVGILAIGTLGVLIGVWWSRPRRG